MRVGLVVPGFSADAADWCIPALRNLTRQLVAEDDVRVVAVRYPYRAARYTVDNTEVIAIGGARRRGGATLSVWRTTLDALFIEHRRRPFDVLHAFWATESGLLAALAGRLLGVPTLVSVAGGELVALPDIAYGDQRIVWERLKIGLSLRLASAVSAGSCQLLATLQRHLPAMRRSKAERLPLGVDVEHMAPTLPRAHSSPHGDGPRLLHVAALTPVKDQQLLLKAFARARRRLPGAVLEMIGDGPLRPALERLAATLGIRDAVCFKGAVDHADLPAVYTASDAVVISSRHEAQCMVALEAAACRRTLIGTRVGVLPELTSDSVPVGDEVSLAGAIEAVCANSSSLAERGGATQAFVRREFSLERSAERFRATYATLARSA